MKPTKKTHVALWILQGALAGLFLFAGGMKLLMPLAALAAVSPLPATFLKLIGVCEIAGALGLLLPGIFHIREELTPLAAAGLAVVMAGATVVTVTTSGFGPALLPFVVGVLAALVARGRGLSVETGLHAAVRPQLHQVGR